MTWQPEERSRPEGREHWMVPRIPPRGTLRQSETKTGGRETPTLHPSVEIKRRKQTVGLAVIKVD